MTCNVKLMRCLSSGCDGALRYCGSQDGLHFLSSKTAAGDEIGWDFVALVRGGKLSFTGFVNEISRRYKTTNVGAIHAFMGLGTFIAWYMTWLVALGIDFRSEEAIDRWCMYNPDVLAMDGTHISCAINRLCLDKACTKSDVNDTVFSKHKRFHRVFLPYPEKTATMTIKEHNRLCREVGRARYFLKYICRKVLDKPIAKEMTPVVETQELQHLMSIASMQEASVANFLIRFLTNNMPTELILAAAKLLNLLSGDSNMSSVLPFESHAEFLSAATALEMGPLDEGEAQKLLDPFNYVCKELGLLFFMANKHDEITLVTSFVRRLIEQIHSVHEKDRPTPPARRIPGTYNPPSGTAYYFTPSGDQLRRQPNYEVQGGYGNAKEDIYDDKPEVDEPCVKKYPQTSYGGWGYMFLVFCPIHGHCYGFHLIDGGEGRKDGFSPLYKYKPTAPKDLYYDFACQLSEYSLNREPDFFKNTKYYHDIFHGLVHKCGNCFKSTRICGRDAINSSICEQFNAFLQCIKFTASHLSQTHLMLFVQFFIYLWNRDKTERYTKMARVTVGGSV